MRLSSALQPVTACGVALLSLVRRRGTQQSNSKLAAPQVSLPPIHSTGQVTAARGVFALPVELCGAILEIAAAMEGNLALNRLALVSRSWHNMLAPPAGACMPALTWHVTLSERDLLAVDQNVRPWWRWIKARSDATDAGLASLAAVCTTITKLSFCSSNYELAGSRHITDTGLASLASGCTAITNLNLFGCSNITDTGLASLAAGCTAITTLNLHNCNQITDIGLANLAAHCATLATLHLGGWSQITDTGLASLASGCTAITNLHLHGCGEITDTGLASLAAGCTAITTVNLYNCNQITDIGLASLTVEYPNIRIKK